MNVITITLPESGAVLSVRRQPIDVLRRIQRISEERHPKPIPPKVRVETGPNEFHEIDNANDKAYTESLSEWETRTTFSLGELLIQTLVKVAVIHDAQFMKYVEEAKEIQSFYNEIGLEVPADIFVFTMTYHIAKSSDDLNMLIFEVFGKSLPKEEQVALHRHLFQGNV